MFCRVVEVYEENRFLSLNRGFLEVKSKNELLGSVPLDDIGVLLLSAQGVSMTKNVLNALAEKAALLCCAGQITRRRAWCCLCPLIIMRLKQSKAKLKPPFL